MHGAELFFHIVSLPPHSVCVCMYIVSKRFGIKFPIYCVCAPHFLSAAREGVRCGGVVAHNSHKTLAPSKSVDPIGQERCECEKRNDAA